MDAPEVRALPTDLVFVDLETTGGNAAHHRIIEIGIVRLRDGVVIEEWSTLVNPECVIPPYIESFTGISNRLVGSAPRFADIGRVVLDKLKPARVRAGVRRPQRPLRLRIPARGIPSRRLGLLRAGAVHREALAAPFSRGAAAQSRRRDGAPRARMQRASPGARRCAGHQRLLDHALPGAARGHPRRRGACRHGRSEAAAAPSRGAARRIAGRPRDVPLLRRAGGGRGRGAPLCGPGGIITQRHPRPFRRRRRGGPCGGHPRTRRPPQGSRATHRLGGDRRRARRGVARARSAAGADTAV